MSNIKTPSIDAIKRESSLVYNNRVTPIKEQIIYLGEKNMDNTVWVIRRWLNDEMGLINKPRAKKVPK